MNNYLIHKNKQKVTSHMGYVEFILSFLGMKNMKIASVAVLISLFSGFISYFEDYIFFDFWLFVLFNVAMFMDILSGVMLSKYRGGSFETHKAMRALIKIVGYNWLLYFASKLIEFIAGSGASAKIINAISHLISPEVAEIITTLISKYHLTPFMVFLYAFIIVSLSALKNFQLADVFQSMKKLDRWIYKSIDLYKNRPEDRLWDTMTTEQKRKIMKDVDAGAEEDY